MKSYNDVHVLQMSRERAEEVQLFWPHAWISFTNPNSQPANLRLNEHTVGVLRCPVDDLDQEPGPSYRLSQGRDAVLFDDDDAKVLAGFVKRVLGGGAKAIAVHCEAGVSRSGAVTTALNRVLRVRVTSEHKPIPNSLILLLTQRALMKEFAEAQA